MLPVTLRVMSYVTHQDTGHMSRYMSHFTTPFYIVTRYILWHTARFIPHVTLHINFICHILYAITHVTCHMSS